jgi:hypothetical protein
MVFGRFIFLYATNRAETIPGCRSTFIRPYSGLKKILLICTICAFKLHSLTMFDYWIVCFGFSLMCSKITMKMNTENLTITLLYSSLSIERLLRRILRNQCWGIKVTLCDEDRKR